MNIDDESLAKLKAVNNKHAEDIVEAYARLCKPKRVVVFDDSEEDMKKIRELALSNGEEAKLDTEGHTFHFDSIDKLASFY